MTKHEAAPPPHLPAMADIRAKSFPAFREVAAPAVVVLVFGINCPKRGQMLHRAAVSDKALGLLMDRCRATFANPEADGGFTLYSYPNRSQVKYRVTAKMHRAAIKCIKTGVLCLRGEIDPIRIDSDIRGWDEFH